MGTRKRRNRALPPFVQQVRDRFRGWWIEDGVRRFGQLVDDPLEAHRIAVERRAGVRAPKGRLTLGEAIAAARAANGRLAAKTRESYEERWKVMLQAFEAGKYLDSFTVADVEWFARRRIERGAAPNTVVKHDLKALHRLFVQTKALGLLPDIVQSPVPAATKPETTEPLRPVLPWRVALESLERVRAGSPRCASLDADVLDLLLHTGLRREEAARLTRADRDGRGEGERLVVTGKTGRRVLPVPPPLAGLLDRLMTHERGDGVLSGDTVRRRAGLVRRACERWRVRLSLPALEPHALRRSFATELRVRGVPREVIADLLGHGRKRDSVTDLYLATWDPELHEALALLWTDARWREGRREAAG